MKAVYIDTHGDVNALRYGEHPDPSIEPHEVKIRVRACALNRLDLYTRMGVRGMKREFEKPLILGGDVAGDVVEVGRLAGNVQIGTRVVVDPLITCGSCRYCIAGDDGNCPKRRMLGVNVNGGYAEFTKIPGANVFPISDHISYEEASALPTVFLPAWNILKKKANVQPGETVLILSSSSGVGTAAIQLAKKVLGANVISTTSSARKARLCIDIGADEVIDYTKEDIGQRALEITGGRGVDVVVDHVGEAFYDKAFYALANGGRYGICGVSTGYRANLHMGLMFTKGLSIFGVYMGSLADMREIVDLAESDMIHGTVDRVFSLDEASEAHRLMESQDIFGKIILKIP
jgi:NADPH:quinone reductase-like Zn-dependent oxidoreductase